MQKRLETQACKDATSVIALSEIVKEELINRGIEKEKIYVVPNGVNTDKLVPKEKDQKLLLEYGWQDKFIVGFIGSVVDYEGLPLLIKTAEKIYQSGNDNIRYLIVGDGNDLENLKQEVEKRSLSHLFIFTGRVPYEEVEQYYSIINIACYPRLNWEVCSIVSPKKPFEAMAYGIPVISSSVHANSYFINNGVTGLIHSYENVNSIVEKIDLLYKDSILREKITKNARDWVVQNRDSKITGPLMKKIYLETIEKYNSTNQI
jgi:glycosyltransferase involved in cell wall biosynthesis